MHFYVSYFSEADPLKKNSTGKYVLPIFCQFPTVYAFSDNLCLTLKILLLVQYIVYKASFVIHIAHIMYICTVHVVI